MQLDALLKAQGALATISKLVAMIAAPRDSGAMTILGTRGFNQADEPCAARVQRFNGSTVMRLKGCTTSDSRLSRPSSLDRALQGSKQTLNGQSGKWAARPR